MTHTIYILGALVVLSLLPADRAPKGGTPPKIHISRPHKPYKPRISDTWTPPVGVCIR